MPVLLSKVTLCSIFFPKLMSLHTSGCESYCISAPEVEVISPFFFLNPLKFFAQGFAKINRILLHVFLNILSNTIKTSIHIISIFILFALSCLILR